MIPVRILNFESKFLIPVRREQKKAEGFSNHERGNSRDREQVLQCSILGGCHFVFSKQIDSKPFSVNFIRIPDVIILPSAITAALRVR